MNIKTIILAIILLISTNAFAANVYEPVIFDKNEVTFSNASKQINSTNPTAKTNAQGSIFPGGRGAGQLVIYTSAFGERTNTNEFGTEAIVNGNVVTMISGANSFIPPDGIVISGHGAAKNWIQENITIGTRVFINAETNTINAYTTSQSYMFEAEEKIIETKSMIEYYRSKITGYNWREPNNHIQDAQNYLNKAKKDSDDQEHVQKYTKLAIEEANAGLTTVLPYIPNEIKGVWIRPTENSETQIINTINRMQKTGVNNIFIETFYHGKTIFPSKTMDKYGFITQNELFTAIDPLSIWIREAHKRNMKVHIWFQSFYVGNTPPARNAKSILSVHPDWGNKTKLDYTNTSATTSRSEHNGYFIDPANPEVQEFLMQLINEIISTYKPDGINLDYIRYPQSIYGNESGSWGYTAYARTDFTKMYGTDPINISLKDPLWKQWENYRRENITNFVRKIGAIGRQNNVYISAVIFPDVENALNNKQQDWRTWSKRNYVNGFTPLFLTYDPKMVSSMMNDVMNIKSPSTDVFAGIFVTFMGGSNEDLVRQIHETRKLAANGVILFDYAHTTDKYIKTLSNGVFEPKRVEEPTPTVIKKRKKWFEFFCKKK